MKHLFTSLSLITCLSATAQNSFDMEIAITSPADGTTFYVGDNLVVDIEITNHGAVLPQDDTLYLAFVLDGVFYGPNTGVIQGASVGGGGVSFPVPGVSTFTNLTEGNHTLCAWMVGLGSQLFGQNFDLSGVSDGANIGAITINDVANGDGNPADNEFCINFVVEDTTSGGGGGGTASISENDLNSFRVFPNPASNRLNVTAPGEGAEFILTDMLGQEVIREMVYGDVELNTSFVQAGTYIARIRGINNEILREEMIVITR